MRICLFAQHKYAVDILRPIQLAAEREGENEIIWFVDARNIAASSANDKDNVSNSIQEIFDFSPEVIFCPGNIIPYYLPGVKICIFHGYATKKDQFIIRRYFDIYYTQGPFYTKRFEELKEKYNDFEVLETGWTRQDWIFNHKDDFVQEKNELLRIFSKNKVILYAPTFSPSFTSIPLIKDELVNLAKTEDIIVICKFHPLTKQEWIDEYKELAKKTENIIYIDDSAAISKYILICDMLISDSSSTIYEGLLLDKPVITLKTIEKDIYWKNISKPEELRQAYSDVLNDDKYTELRRWVIDNYDPYLDGKVGERMLEGARDFIRRHGVPKYRKLNLWRVYTSINTFGRIRKG